MKHKSITLSCLSELQATKWFLLHERKRHLDNVDGIDKDLEKLNLISLPIEVLDIVGFSFEIPETTKKNLTFKQRLNDMIRGKKNE